MLKAAKDLKLHVTYKDEHEADVIVPKEPLSPL